MLAEGDLIKELPAQNGDIQCRLSWSAKPFKRYHMFPLDLAVVIFTKAGELFDAAFRTHLVACNGAINHSGPFRPALEETNLEVCDILVQSNLDSVPTEVAVIMFVVSAFDSGTMDLCDGGLKLNIYQSDNMKSEVSFAHSELGNSKGLILGAIFKHTKTDKWNFAACSEPVAGRHYTACVRPMRAIVSRILELSTVAEVLQVDKTIDMHKGDQLTIPTSVTKLIIGLGWETTTENLDLDASCVLLNDVDGDGDLDPIDAVYFLQKDKPGIHSTGDNRTGEGDGDDEQIHIDLERVDARVSSIAVVVTIFAEGRSFKEVSDAYVRIADKQTGHEFCRYALSGGNLSKSALVFCMLNRGSQFGEPWSLVSIGEECDGRRVTDLKTKLWDGVWTGERRTENILCYRKPEVALPTRPVAGKPSRPISSKPSRSRPSLSFRTGIVV